MTVLDKIASIDVRINLLKSRGESMNAPIIKKLERKKRVLMAKG